MKSRFYFVILLFSLIYTLGSLELGVSGGFSSFRYLEVSKNLKEDLYTINSRYIGLRAKKRLYGLYFIGDLSLQMPYEVYLEDLYGKDSTNYLEGMFYYGINTQIGVLYPIVESRVNLSVGLLFNMDHFYFKDLEINPGDEFYFSSLGNGVQIDFNIPISKVRIGILSSFSVNYIPLHRRGDEYKWSNNFRVGPYFSVDLP